MSRRALLWMVPMFLVLHNLEELVFMPSYLGSFTAPVPGWAARLLPADFFPPTQRQFLIVLLVVTVLPYLFALMGGARRARSPRTFFLAALQVGMLVNVFSHLMMWNLSNGYVPGLATALAFNLPFSLTFIGIGLRGGWLRATDFAYLVPAAILLHGPGLFGLMLIAKLFVV